MKLRNDRLQLAHKVALGVRIAVSVALLVLAMTYETTHGFLFRTDVRLLAGVTGFTVGIMLAGVIVQIAVYVVLATLLTRTRTVQWVSPRQCTELNNWIFGEWSFYRAGWQRGYRVLGLEVVTCGRL
jgi:hypothetical protein